MQMDTEDSKIEFSKTISVLVSLAKMLCAPWIRILQFKDNCPQTGFLKVCTQHSLRTCQDSKPLGPTMDLLNQKLCVFLFLFF